MHRKIVSIRCDEIFFDPIIGYDKEFWKYCIEEDKVKISGLKWSDNKHKLMMRCANIHDYKMTPFEFKNMRKCPICIQKGELGAVKVDPTISFYYDDIYIIEEISENSMALFNWCCPICHNRYKKTMVEMLNVFPKCDYCNDGKPIGFSDIPDDMTYLK